MFSFAETYWVGGGKSSLSCRYFSIATPSVLVPNCSSKYPYICVEVQSVDATTAASIPQTTIIKSDEPKSTSQNSGEQITVDRKDLNSTTSNPTEPSYQWSTSSAEILTRFSSSLSPENFFSSGNIHWNRTGINFCRV